MKITGDDKSAQAALARLEAKLLSVESKIKAVGAGSRKSSDDTTTSLLGMAAGYLSVGAAIGLVNKVIGAASAAHAQWIANAKEAIGVADKLVPALKPLLSGSGRQATEATMKIAAEAGIGDRPGAFGLADALEDAMGGDTKAAQRELKEVLDVFRLGDIPMEGIKEFATQAAGFEGKDVGQIVRQLHLVSQRFKVSPETMTKTLAMEERIGGPEEALSFAAMMQSKLPGRKAIGGMEGVLEALGPDADEKMRKQFKRIAGVTPGMPLFEQLDRFAKAGQDTMAEFEKLGAKGATAQNLAFAVQGLDKMLAVRAELAGPAATEGAVLGQIARMEAESPVVREERERETREAMDEQERILGPMARAQAAEDARRQAAGGALRKMGFEQAFGVDLIDAEGRAVETLLARIARELVGVGTTDPTKQLGTGEGVGPRVEFLKEMKETSTRLDAAAAHLENATRNMQGGPALVPRGEDK